MRGAWLRLVERFAAASTVTRMLAEGGHLDVTSATTRRHGRESTSDAMGKRLEHVEPSSASLVRHAGAFL